ncbi:hypothetical protein DU500_09080 [Haloplanus rubicundus]|uniref:Uncharacterized protein n=1 Tax=Haloplanus rubicundus TaxID=1547898 RepID=A0A345E2Z4_9EURY|nr:hypothetical protein DU500_09080 [Haloplanus rubicundus]
MHSESAITTRLTGLIQFECHLNLNSVIGNDRAFRPSIWLKGDDAVVLKQMDIIVHFFRIAINHPS